MFPSPLSRRRRWLRAPAWAAVVAAVLAGTLLALARPAGAAQLTQVTGFGPNPTNLAMHLYVPTTVAQRPAVLVAVHYCTGSGPAFYSGTEFAALADRYGFVVVYPSATRSGACFDVSSPGALRHDGTSDPVGIKSMVDHVLQRYAADPARVFVTGASSGAMMTNVLLGDYPDVFAAGAAFMGVPFGCFATTDGSSWNSQCAQGQLTRTPQAWGDLVRGAYPGWTGARPRMQLWHGVTDDTLRYPNLGEEIKQWTNVHGVSPTPVLTDSPRSGGTHTRYGTAGARPPVEAYSIAGVGHSLPQGGMASQAIRFFGLDTTAPGPSPTRTSPVPTQTWPSTPPPAPASCRVAVATSAWNTGLTANVTITNTGTATVSSWALGFTLPAGQAITSGWSATYAPASGAVTARSVSYNGTLAPGASTTIGYQANHTGNPAAPAGYTLNGAACTVA